MSDEEIDRMTDEEMAETQIKKWDSLLYPQMYPVALVKDFIRKAYLAGLEAGRPKWHDLRKDPNDLPKKADDYITNIGVLTYDSYGNGVYKWHTPLCEACDYMDEADDGEVIAWCEMPKYTKE